MSKQKNSGGKDAESGQSKSVALNRKAKRDYEIIDRLEAGMSLTGAEVKSARAGEINLQESYVRITNRECFLVGCHFAPYTYARQDEVDPTRDRKLLLHRKEIERLDAQIRQKGLTAVPLAMYFNGRGRCKIEIGLGRGKKTLDKREDIKAREAKRYLERAMKR